MFWSQPCGRCDVRQLPVTDWWREAATVDLVRQHSLPATIANILPPPPAVKFHLSTLTVSCCIRKLPLGR